MENKNLSRKKPVKTEDYEIEIYTCSDSVTPAPKMPRLEANDRTQSSDTESDPKQNSDDFVNVVEADLSVAYGIDELKTTINEWGRKLEQQMNRNFIAINVRLDEMLSHLDAGTIVCEKKQNNFSKLLDIFPLSTLEDADDLDEKLKDYKDPSYRNQITSEMQKSVLTSKSTLKSILTDEILHHYNFDGKKSKKALKDLEIVKILFETKYRPSMSWDDFSQAMKEEVRASHNRLAVRKSTEKKIKARCMQSALKLNYS